MHSTLREEGPFSSGYIYGTATACDSSPGVGLVFGIAGEDGRMGGVVLRVGIDWGEDFEKGRCGSRKGGI